MRLKHTGSSDREHKALQGSSGPPKDGVAGKVATAAEASGNIVVALPFEQASQPNAGDTEMVHDRLVDRQIQAAIGRQLRMMFNDIAAEPVPEKLVKLLDELAAKQDGKS